tara:strand:- start:1696 stop:2040 length:345 start_codon:yes stop_codon:yes gene_type:complete
MEQIQNKIDEKFKIIEEQQKTLKENQDWIRLMKDKEIVSQNAFPKEVKLKVISDLLNTHCIISKRMEFLYEEIVKLMTESMELLNKETADSFKELGAQIAEDYDGDPNWDCGFK